MENQETNLIIKEKNITDAVANKINNLVNSKQLVLPKNYSVANALKSAYLYLADKNLLESNSTSLAQALLDMVVQGLNPSKKQCYFIKMGDKIVLLKSYFGEQVACEMAHLVKSHNDINAYPIYKGDKVSICYDENNCRIVKVETSWENMNNEIVGAWGSVKLPDGRVQCDIMTIDRIKKSWEMSSNYGGKNKLQNNYVDEAVRRTLIRHMVKNLFNSSTDDNLVIDSMSNSMNFDEDKVIDAKIASNQVEEEQQRRMASVKVNAATDEVNNPVEPNETPNLNSNVTPDFDPMSLEI